MKKIVLSLSALFAVSMASAQSYIKQPDPTTYEVIEHKATKPAQESQPSAQPQQPAQEASPATQDAFTSGTQQGTAQTPARQPATKPDNKLVQNRKR